MSSPAPFMQTMDLSGFDNADMEASSRPMRVKVLYSFDSSISTNCLARLPNTVSIPTILSDEGVPIGVIELQHCVKAIVAASPELVSRLEQGDFTIYAVDYSEPDAPQVGQGMLSAALSQTSTAVQHGGDNSDAFVTGLVTRNMLGLFSKGAAETLEVRLRLVPVPRSMQNDFSQVSDLQRLMSPAMPLPFHHHQNTTSGQYSSSNNLVANLEQQSHNFSGYGQMNHGHSSQHQRRMSTATVHTRPNSASQHRSFGSRPASRASMHSVQPPQQRVDSANETNEEFADDGPARKRAKVTQTDWKGRSTFGGSADSLRVTASTAASIRVHKPVATRPGLPTQGSLEPPPRVPTPVPQDTSRSRARAQVSSLLRRESSLLQPHFSQIPFDTQSDAVMSSPEDMQIDDGGVSPLEFPSSPPQMPEPSSPGLPPNLTGLDSGYMSGGALDYMQEEPRSDATYKEIPQRSSLRRERDPFVGETPGPPELLPTRMNTTVRPRKVKATQESSDRRPSLALPPRPSLLSTHTESFMSTESNMPQVPGASNGEVNVYMAGDVNSFDVSLAQQGDDSTCRHTSMAPPSRSVAASPAPGESLPFGGKPRSGSGAKRRKAIQTKLLQSLADGNMPQFCQHCGAIETPTWRALYMKTVEGVPPEEPEPDAVQGEEAETGEKAEKADKGEKPEAGENPETGETRGVEVLERDEVTNEVKKYRIIKSIRKTQDRNAVMQDFELVTVCNPCGLWFNKFKSMRPADKWAKRKYKRKKKGTAGAKSDAPELPSDYQHSDMPQSEFWTDQVMPDDSAMTGQNDEADVEQQSSSENEEGNNSRLPEAPSAQHQAQRHDPSRPRADSMHLQLQTNVPRHQWGGADLESALQRAVQSSPAQFMGTKHSPIELDDLTPKPTRRLLFPSPRTEGQTKSLEGLSFAPVNKTPNKGDNPRGNLADDLFIGMAFTPNGKENLPPMPTDEEIAKLFEMSPSEFFKTPSKPVANAGKMTPPSKSIATFETLLQTPTPSRLNTKLSRTPGNMDAFLPSFSSAEKRDLLGTPGRYMSLTSPARSISGTRTASGEILPPLTPFTRHLTQFFNDHNNHTGLDFLQDPTGDDAGLGLGELFSPATLAFAREARTGSGFSSSPIKALDFGMGGSPVGKHAASGERGNGQPGKGSEGVKVEVVDD